MADVSHELGSLRFVVESPLSSKVAMFNNQVNQHQQAQLLNPFSTSDGRASPKPTFSKDQYGKPLAGSLTEMRGQKANIHVMKEMVELCQIIDSEGYNVKDEPNMRVIPFGELFNIYNYISDKVVGILLRARKHKLVEFEGEMLFQRRDDDVPVFLLRPIQSIRQELEAKIDEIKRSTSPAPQSTSVLLDKSAHQQKLQDAGLAVPRGKGGIKSRTPSPLAKKPISSKSATPEPKAVTPEPKAATPEPKAVTPEPTTAITAETIAAIPIVPTVDAQQPQLQQIAAEESLTTPQAAFAEDAAANAVKVTQEAQQQSDVAANMPAIIIDQAPTDEIITANDATTVDDNNNKADANINANNNIINTDISSSSNITEPAIVIEATPIAPTPTPTPASDAALEVCNVSPTDAAASSQD